VTTKKPTGNSGRGKTGSSKTSWGPLEGWSFSICLNDFAVARATTALGGMELPEGRETSDMSRTSVWGGFDRSEGNFLKPESEPRVRNSWGSWGAVRGGKRADRDLYAKWWAKESLLETFGIPAHSSLANPGSSQGGGGTSTKKRGVFGLGKRGHRERVGGKNTVRLKKTKCTRRSRRWEQGE